MVVASQAVGGAAGNMVTVHNVVAAAAVVGLVGREGDLIRRPAIPMTYYLLAAGSVARLTLHLGTVTLAVMGVAGAVWGLRMRRAPAPQPGSRARQPGS